MKKILYSISMLITALFLCGFVAGVEIGDPEDKQPAEPTGPIVEYIDTIAPYKSSQELYQQYHLLAISSLEEAESSFQENRLWTYRMARNASNYIKLLNGLVIDAKKPKYGEVLERLKPVIDSLKNKNRQEYKAIKFKDELKSIAKTLEQDYSWEKVKTWIKE
ncbi:MAG: hypothetical protein V1747_06085 [Candidatus Omnitrophota bacterium]